MERNAHYDHYEKVIAEQAKMLANQDAIMQQQTTQIDHLEATMKQQLEMLTQQADTIGQLKQVYLQAFLLKA